MPADFTIVAGPAGGAKVVSNRRYYRRRSDLAMGALLIGGSGVCFAFYGKVIVRPMTMGTIFRFLSSFEINPFFDEIGLDCLVCRFRANPWGFFSRNSCPLGEKPSTSAPVRTNQPNCIGKLSEKTMNSPDGRKVHFKFPARFAAA